MERYSEMRSEFEEGLEGYRRMGVNPFSLATGCSVKVDLVGVLYPALRSVGPDLMERGLSLAPRRDAAVFRASSSSYEVMRGVYDVEDPRIDAAGLRAFRPNEAMVLMQVHRSAASSPERFGELALRLYSRIAAACSLRIGKGHSIVTANPSYQFSLVDYVRAEGDGDRLVAANNDTMQVVDPAEGPGSPRQAAAAISNALNDLFVVGAWRGIRVLPVYDAPSDELRAEVRRAMEGLLSGLGAEVMDVEQPNRGAILIGATAFAETDREPPFFFQQVEPGMEVLLTRPMGELALINTYMLVMMDDEVAREFEAKSGMSVEDLLELKERTMDMMAKPNVDVAKAIGDRLPRLGEEFDPEVHVAVTTDVTGPGLYVVKELAELSSAWISLERIPLVSPAVSAFATENFVMPNATAGTNGATVVIARPGVLDGLEDDLRRSGYSPVRIGRVVAKGAARVTAPAELRGYIASSAYLREFDLA